MKAAITLLDILLRIVIVVSLVLLMFSCEPEYPQPYEKFTIPEGKHSKGFPLQALESTRLEFTAIFDESAIYQSQDELNQWDVNKLMGFADCNSHHHQNSARFGWAWLDDELMIYAYAYVSGERIIESIGVVSLNEPANYSITLTKDHYLFQLNDFKEVRISRESKCDVGLYYMLFPYFGGNEVAPHDITILIKQHF